MQILPFRPATAAVALALGMTAFAAQANEPLRPSDHVELLITPHLESARCDNPSIMDARAFNTRLYPDGTAGPFDFPSEQVLVVTSLDASNATPVAPGTPVRFRVFRLTSGIPALNTPGIHRVVADSDGRARARFKFSPGLVVPSGTQLCVYAAHSGTTDRTFEERLQGYLARDR
jgi:hypothetical protein